MNNSKSFARPWIISATLGLSSLLGLVAGHLLTNRKQTGNQILQQVIADFKHEGTVEGSWIDHHSFPYQRFATKTMVYRGGIQRREDDQMIDYVFLADAYTGSILKIQRLDRQ